MINASNYKHPVHSLRMRGCEFRGEFKYEC